MGIGSRVVSGRAVKDIFEGIESVLADKTEGVVVHTVDNLPMLQWKCANTQGCNFGDLLRAIPYLRKFHPPQKSQVF